MNETTHTTTTSKTPWIFWVLALIAVGVFVYFVFGTEKIVNDNALTIPDGESIVIEGLPTDDNTVVATVNGQELTRGEVNELINSDLIGRGINFADLLEEEQANLVEESTDLMVEYLLLIQAANASDVSIDEAAIDAQLAQIKAQFSEEELASQLTQLGVSEETLTETLKESQLIDAYLQAQVADQEVVVTEGEIDTELAAAVEQSGGQEAFEAEITNYGMDMEAVRESIRQSLEAEKRQALVTAHITSLRAQAEVEMR